MVQGATCPHCGFDTAAGLKNCPACKKPMAGAPPAAAAVSPAKPAKVQDAAARGMGSYLLGLCLMIGGIMSGFAFFTEPSSEIGQTVVNYGLMNQKTNGCVLSAAAVILGGILWSTSCIIEAIDRNR